MAFTFKEVLLGSTLIGGIFNCVISPSYGMISEEEVKKTTTRSFNHYQDDITSLPSVERKINQTEVIYPSLEDAIQLHRNVHSLTTQAIDLWVKAAETGDLTSLYHLGWFVCKREKAKQPLSKQDKSRSLTFEK